jgi:carbamoyl-phosphate synthase large subunit
MKSVGEAMAMGRTFQQAFAKAMRSRELDAPPRLEGTDEELLTRLESRRPTATTCCSRCCAVASRPARSARAPASTPWFLEEFAELAPTRRARSPASARSRRSTPARPSSRRARRTSTRAGSARQAHEVDRGDRPSVVILGSGPNRIGQGIEFDYCCVHAAMTVRDAGRDAVMINCNPETVSTDYDTSDRLYFEPLTLEDVLGVSRSSSPRASSSSSAARRRSSSRTASSRPGVTILGTSVDAIDLAEDRGRFGDLLDRLGYQAPPYATAHSVDEALDKGDEVGFPLLVRPSYVLGGRAMEIVYSDEALADYLARERRGPRAAPTGRSTSTASSRTHRGRRRRAVRRRAGLDRRHAPARRGGRRSTRVTAPRCCRRTRWGPRCSSSCASTPRGSPAG